MYKHLTSGYIYKHIHVYNNKLWPARIIQFQQIKNIHDMLQP